MLTDFYAWITLFITIGIVFSAYLYSYKVYGIKLTIIVALLLFAFVLVGVLTGGYSAANLFIYPPFTATLNHTEFLITDPFSIFPSFLIIFELARYSVSRLRGSELTNRDILIITLLTSFYGICHQMFIDSTAGALGYYYVQNPPAWNIFGFPIIFLLSFTIYGLWGGIILLVEKKKKQ